ncbi:hypothetical protein RhiLY_08720 [Ceratobasidium sp. AG-Ba]|nr:hypothetical protein RhiLY_08720 [Ceratobasidium sp. AG-Ba]
MVLPAFITKGLKLIIESVGGEVLSKLTSNAFKSILGPDAQNPPLVTDPQVRAELQDIISGLGNLSDGLKKLGHETESFKLQAKPDRIQDWVDSIDSILDEYWTTIQQLAKCATGGSDEPNMRQFKLARQRSCDLGERIKTELYALTVRIDSFVSGTGRESYFTLVNQQNLDDCDFYSYFCRMNEERAILLPHSQDPAVGFVTGNDLADLVRQRLDAQEKYVNTLMPESAVKLATAFANDKSGTATLSIILKTHKGRYIHGGTSASDTTCYTDANRVACKLEPVQSVAVPQLGKDYYFYFRSDFARMVVNISGSNILPVFSAPAVPFLDVWKIQITSLGEFRLKPLNLQDPFFSNIKKFMAVGWYGEYGPRMEDPDFSNQNEFYTIELL